MTMSHSANSSGLMLGLDCDIAVSAGQTRFASETAAFLPAELPVRCLYGHAEVVGPRQLHC